MAYLKILLVVDFYPVIYFRLIEYCRERKTLFRRLFKVFLVPIKPLTDGLSGARIYSDAIIDGGLLLHQSSGVVIAPGTTIGKNCTFFSGACVVYKANFGGSAAPVIGDNVKLMVGCKVIGDVKIGNDSFIGANAVVVSDVPEYSIAVGIPARIKPRRDAPVNID
jgi:serine O-acetyltransferase